MKKTILVLFILLIASIVGFLWFVKPLLEIYVGFSAKTVCSCHFIQNRSVADIEKDELSVAAFIDHTIKKDQQVVRSSFLGVERLAMFRIGLGCSLLSEKTESELPAIQLRRKVAPINYPVQKNQYPALQPIVNKAFEEPFTDKAVHTRAVVIIKDSVIIAEQYAAGYTSTTPQMGWSMTKSVTNALVGILVKQGKMDVHKPAAVKAWYDQQNDPRQAITLDHLMRMSSGLHFVEEYDKVSTVNRMLWTKADAGKEAYAQPLQYPVDSVWYYSSGTTNIIGHLIRQQFPDYQEYLHFPYNDLLDKLGMETAVLETDANGTYVGSSLMYASARDWAKFGMLYLQNGNWQGEQILPKDWVAYSTTRTPTLSPYGFYGAQFWLNALEEPPNNEGIPRKWEGVPADAYYAAGFEGQTVLVIPSENMVIVRLGQTLDRTAWDMGAFARAVLKVI